MQTVRLLIVAVVAAAVWALTACSHHGVAQDVWDYSPEQVDSLNFARQHHYSLGYNFRVVGDSIELQPGLPADDVLLGDSCAVRDGDRVVVADIRIVQNSGADSVWVKIARDQTTMGWTTERELLRHVCPDDPISAFIHIFSNRVVMVCIFIVILTIAFQLTAAIRHGRIRTVHFNDIDSIYPTALCMTVAGAAVLYAALQMFCSDAWQEFYYHPTLNPFGQRPVMSLFLIFVWLIIILSIAAVDDVGRKLGVEKSLPYLVSMFGMVLVLYLFFSVSAMFYVGYVCLPLYWTFAVLAYRRHSVWRYTCGKCGHRLRYKGICPYCGANNV